MVLNIQNPLIEKMVKNLSSVTGETDSEVVARAVEERMARLSRSRINTVEGIQALVKSFHIQRINEDLTEDEILGYGVNGYCE